MGSVLSGAGNFLGQIPGSIAGGAAEGAGATNQFQAGNPYSQAVLQNELDQQAQIYGGQQSLAQALQAQMNGQGPNPAQTMFNANQQSNIANSQGLIASQRGLNPALAARMGANAATVGNQQAALGSALLQQQQQLGATQGLGNLYGQMQQGNLGYQNLYGQGAMGAQNINARIGSENAGVRGKLAGGLLNSFGGALAGSSSGGGGGGGGISSMGDGGGGAAAAAAAHGAYIGGKARVPGDSPKNDTVRAMLSPGEIVIPRSISHDPEAAKKFVEAIIQGRSSSSGSGYGDVLKARQLKKKTDDGMKMYDGGSIPQNIYSDDPQSIAGYRELAQRTIGDSSPPVGQDQIQPSMDAMDFIPPEQMAMGAMGLGKSIVGKMAAAKGAGMVIPMAAGAIRRTAGGSLLGTVSEAAMRQGSEGVEHDLAQQALQRGLYNNAEDAVSAASVKPTYEAPPSIVDSVKARFGDHVSPDKWAALEVTAKNKNVPYVPISVKNKHAGVYPNMDATPTGIIGNPKDFADPKNIFKKAEHLNWYDSKYGATKELIKKHSEQGMPVNITTASDLIARDDYLNVLPNGSKVNIVLPHPLVMADSAAREITKAPELPSNTRLLKAYDKLKKNGINANLFVPNGKSIQQIDPFTVKKLLSGVAKDE